MKLDASVLDGIGAHDDAARLRKRERNADTGMVYRGACDLIHIADGERVDMGAALAHRLDAMMRSAAYRNGSRSRDDSSTQRLCPGCYMVALYNAALTLATENGQSVAELGRSLSRAFDQLATLAESGDLTGAHIESIAVALDAEGDR